jgi:hypothetical protein
MQRRLAGQGLVISAGKKSGLRSGKPARLKAGHDQACPRRDPALPAHKPLPPAPPAEQFAAQDQATHDEYGLGRVVSVEDDTALVIDLGAHHDALHQTDQTLMPSAAPAGGAGPGRRPGYRSGTGRDPHDARAPRAGVKRYPHSFAAMRNVCRRLCAQIWPICVRPSC